ncbi:MAG: two-component regulator propeller domain-containing protein [Bacteroidota bacterium]
MTSLLNRKSAYLLLSYLIGVVGLLATESMAQPTDKLFFQQISLEDGLSQSTVNGIVQDSTGFIWLGTTNGLNRYDGHSIKSFTFDRFDEQSLSNNYIMDMEVGPGNNIWIATYGGGVNVMDPIHEKVFHLTRDTSQTQTSGLLSNDVFTVHVDEKGQIWMGTLEGLNKYNPQDSTFHSYQHSGPNKNINQARNAILDIEKGPEGKLWMGTVYGLELFDPVEGSFTQEMFSKEQKGKIGRYVIRTLELDKNGHLWIGTEQNGLHRIDNATFHSLPMDDAQKKSIDINDTRISEIVHDFSGNIWVATQDGLRTIRMNGGKIASVASDLIRTHGLMDNDLSTLFIDNSRNIWIGTGIAGALHADLKPSKFGVLRQGGDKNMMSDRNEIWSIHQDNDSTLWLGASDGLYTYNRKSKQFHKQDIASSIPGVNAVTPLGVAARNDQYIWLATEYNGLMRLDRETGERTSFTPDTGSFRISSQFLSSIEFDNRGRLWVGTFQDGFDIVDLDRGQVQSFNAENDSTEGQGRGLVSNKVQTFFEDSQGRMWIGTLHGLSRMNEAGGLEQIPITIENLRNQSNFSITTIQEDERGNIWLGTNSGILVHDPTMGTFTYLNETHGLPDNYIYGLLNDPRGGFWASTNKGLSYIYPEEEQPMGYAFQNYDVYDGLQNNEFNSGAYYQRNGELFFGGINGLNHFKPEEIDTNPFEPPVVITSLSKIKQADRESTNLLGKDQIKLQYFENVIQFDFAALDFTQPQKNKYAYQLEGFDRDWVYAVDEPTVIYTNLNPGTYTFKVKAANNDGLWNEVGDQITLTIIPPFWQTTWFYLLLSMAGIGMIWGIVYWRARQDRRIQRMLRDKVRDRTRELEESEEQFRLISENAADLISVIDEDGEFIYVSPSHKKLLGYSKEDLIGRDVKELIHPEDLEKVIGDYKQLLKGAGQIQFHEYRMIRKDGATSMFQTAGSLIKHKEDGKSRLVLISHDVTHRKLTEYELKRARDEAEKANRSKSAFLAGISHELRTPLNAILGYSQILKRDRMLTDRQKNYVDTMYRSGNHLLSMINDVLDISKIEAGRMEQHNDPFDLRELLEDIRKLFTLQCKEKDLEFYFELDERLPNYVYADASKLRQVLINLIGNAVKFTDNGHILLRASTELISEQKVRNGVKETTDLSKMDIKDYHRITFAVKDTGKGISKDQLEDIFEPFQQVDSNLQEGTGLGLAISSRIIDMLGGTMDVDSQLGSGSTFTFDLPVVELSRPEEVEHQSPGRIKKLKEGEQISVLLVDDIEYNLRLMRDLLAPLGFTCYEAQNGQESIAMFEKHNPDLVLMDLRMPTMRGEEAMVQMRKLDEDRNSVIFAVSASGFKGTRDELLALGFDEYIRKPIEDRELLGLIEEYIDVDFEWEEVAEAEDKSEGAETVKSVAETLRDQFDTGSYQQFSEAVELMEIEVIQSLIDEQLTPHDNNSAIQELQRAIDARDYVFLLSLNEVLNPNDKVASS